ncbi:MAG TPA: cytochrome P460 family protein [Edaphobacter sp.]|nr:cytochrome P460 family protein [Edaphobacter sp.]
MLSAFTILDILGTKSIAAGSDYKGGVLQSKKYAATGGWGFAQFTNGKPAGEAALKPCFSCHIPAKANDYVFTRYAP